MVEAVETIQLNKKCNSRGGMKTVVEPLTKENKLG